MSWMEVVLDEGRAAFLPGEELRGAAAWRLETAPESLALRLFWYTQGKGTQDVGIADSLELPPSTEGRREFRFRLPEGPYSFSGKLISLLWAVELVAEPGGETARADLVLSPTRREVRIAAPEAPPPPD